MAGNGGRDQFFVRMVLILAFVMLCFGVASMLLAIYTDASDPVIMRLIGAFGSMFTGIVGLIVGYVSGRGRNGG